MRKIILYILFSLSFVSCNYMYHYDFSEGLQTVTRNYKKDGYANKNNEIIIRCQYERAENFKNGYAFVSKKGKWGVINKNGETVIPLEYDNFKYIYNDSLAILAIGELWGGVNLKGEQVIPFKYNYIGDFSDGYATARRKPDEGETETWYDSGNGDILVENPYGVISSTGKEITEFKYVEMGECSEGYVPYNTPDYGWWWISLNDKYVDMNPAIDAGYDIGEYRGPCETRPFHNGLAAIKWGKHSAESKWGFFNTDGYEIVPCIYDCVSDFHNGFAWVGFKRYGIMTYKFINTIGDFLEIKDRSLAYRKIDSVTSFEDGYARITFRNLKYAYKLYPDGTCEAIMTEEEKEAERVAQEHYNKYGWIVGKWEYKTPYGNAIYNFKGDGESGTYVEVLYDEVNYGTYEVNGNQLKCKADGTNYTSYFDINYSNQSISSGGYYLRKSLF